MKELKIEQGIPIPPKFGGEQYPWRTTAHAMKPGDSVLVESAAHASCLLKALKKAGRKRACRKESGKGMRVWCLE